MSENTLIMMEFEECLYLTSEGAFKLETDGQAKTITPRRAEKWLKKRYPRLSWNKMLKFANEWLIEKKEKKAA
jgi:hypothetical protein